jgi:hypothetical protein
MIFAVIGPALLCASAAVGSGAVEVSKASEMLKRLQHFTAPDPKGRGNHAALQDFFALQVFAPRPSQEVMPGVVDESGPAP